jgi:hypothetical protein
MRVLESSSTGLEVKIYAKNSRQNLLRRQRRRRKGEVKGEHGTDTCVCVCVCV